MDTICWFKLPRFILDNSILAKSIKLLTTRLIIFHFIVIITIINLFKVLKCIWSSYLWILWHLSQIDTYDEINRILIFERITNQLSKVFVNIQIGLLDLLLLNSALETIFYTKKSFFMFITLNKIYFNLKIENYVSLKLFQISK